MATQIRHLREIRRQIDNSRPAGFSFLAKELRATMGRGRSLTTRNSVDKRADIRHSDRRSLVPQCLLCCGE
jgi:hypothetical protein